MALIFFLVYLGSDDNRFTKAVVCSGLVAAIGFVGPYVVEFVGKFEFSSHKHKIVSSEEENVIDATCTDSGSYELVSFCECGEELSREFFPIDPLGHDFINGICSRCGEIDPDYEIPASTTPSDSNKPSENAAYTAKKVNFITYNDSMNSERQTNSYDLEASESGIYRFYMSNMVNGFDVKVYVYDSDGNEIGGSYGLKNDKGFTCKLEKKNIYTIKVTNFSKTGNYTLTIGQPKEPVEITDFDVVNDDIEYTEQQNNYTFIPPISGTYRFELSEIMKNFKLNLYVYDQLGYEVGGSYGLGNYEGVTVDLTAGETYTIKITQNENSGSYILSIGKQQATIDISGQTKISDQIAYTDQQIVYTYTPSVSGKYTISLQNMRSGFGVELYIYDSLDYEIGGAYGLENNDELTVELTADKTYTIHLIQCEEYGTLSLNISS